MINTFVFSRKDIEKADPWSEPHLIISIKTPGDLDARLPTNNETLGILRLAFDDVDGNVIKKPHPGMVRLGPPPEAIPFNDEMADQTLDFILKHKLNEKVHDVLIHCDAGVSRSSAVAAALQLIFSGNHRYYFEKTDLYFPNDLVYHYILARALLRRIIRADPMPKGAGLIYYREDPNVAGVLDPKG